jgi:hypothetical protein
MYVSFIYIHNSFKAVYFITSSLNTIAVRRYCVYVCVCMNVVCQKERIIPIKEGELVMLGKVVVAAFLVVELLSILF